MTNPIIKIHDLEKGTEIERPMTKDEFANWEKMQADAAIKP